jgi:subtilisin-like proprotein convertase family protein
MVAGDQGDQGTAVAGIIAAKGWNGIGSRGVAPNAMLSAYNLKAPRFNSISENDYLRIFSLKSDIVCHSGTINQDILTEQPAYDLENYDRSQKRRIELGRDGLGTIYLKAAGDLAAVGGNSSFDQRNTTTWGMIIGSHNIMGVKSHHSSPGSNLWISAPGGEAGYQSDYYSFDVNLPVVHFYPGLISTDIFNTEFKCAAGYSKLPKYYQEGTDPDPLIHSRGHSSGFNMGWHELNKDCQYTATLPATPAATAVATGAAAILLEKNPRLSWRDMKYIMAKSAKAIDIDRASVISNIGASQYEKTLPWIKNAAGFSFHNWYGFGALDLEAALNIANPATYRSLPPIFDTTWILASSPGKRIPPASIAGVFSDFHQVHNLIIESVQIKLNITHADASHLGIELVSPHGTRSILKSIKDGSRFSGMNSMVFLSNAFYGERSMGTWQLRIVDAKEGQSPGRLNSWSARFVGHKKSGVL